MEQPAAGTPPFNPIIHTVLGAQHQHTLPCRASGTGFIPSSWGAQGPGSNNCSPARAQSAEQLQSLHPQKEKWAEDSTQSAEGRGGSDAAALTRTAVHLQSRAARARTSGLNHAVLLHSPDASTSGESMGNAEAPLGYAQVAKPPLTLNTI